MTSVIEVSSDPVVRGFIEDCYPVLQREFSPEHVILFGSRINGHPRECSDLDVVIVSEAFEGSTFTESFVRVLEALDYNPYVEPLCYTPEQFGELRSPGVGIVPIACREGIWLEEVLGLGNR